MTTTDRAVGVVGKLPGWADFVRLGARGEAFEQLLSWLVAGTELAAAMRRSAFATLSEGSTQAFVYGAGGRSLLCGALAPSCDSVGRCVPVAAAVEVEADDALGRHPELCPIAFEEVWAKAGELILELQAASREEVNAHGWTLPLSLSLAPAAETYESWIREIAVGDFMELVLGDDPKRAPGLLAFVEEAAAPYRGVERPETSLSLRLPLGESGGAAVCFWLDLVRRLTRWRRTVPSFFWSHDGSSGVLMLHLGRAPEAALPELWLPSGACDEICDLVPRGSPAWKSDRARDWAGALSQPGRSLAALLDLADFGI
jgi:type VI secretion system ImpM family protein